MSDQYTYRRDVVEAMIDCVWDSNYGLLASRADQERSAKADPSHGNTVVAMVADIRRAWRLSIEKMDAEILLCRHHYGLGYDAIAELAGLESAAEAAEIEDCAMQALLDRLNGKV